MANDNDNLEKQKNNVKEQLEEQGFALELETYLALKKRGWLTFMQMPYKNIPPEYQNKSFLEQLRDTWNAPPEPIFRTIDITSLKVITSKNPEIQNGSLGLIIECKKHKKENWVFYTESIAEYHAIGVILVGVKHAGGNVQETLDTLSYGELSTFGGVSLSKIKDSKTREFMQKVRKTSHHSLRNMNRFGISHQSVFKPDNPDNIYNACRQVMEACSSVANTDSEAIAKTINDGKLKNYWRMYPVVIFSGDIWEAKFDENFEIQVQKQDWITYLFPYKGTAASIDIVSFKSLNKYLDIIDQEVELLKKVFSKDGEA